MRLVAIMWLSLVGCGRIAFDPLADGGGTDGAEGDGAADACAPFDTTLTISSPGYQFPAAAWTGTQYLMVLYKNAAWSILSVRPDGSEGGYVDDFIPAAGNELLGNGPSAVAWTGSQLGVISLIIGGNALVRTYDPVSGAIAGPFTVNTSAGMWTGGALVWTGDRYIAAWASTAGVYVRELTASGVPITGELVASTTAVAVQSLAVSPTRYVVGSINATSQNSVVVVDRATLAPTTTLVDTVDNGGAQVVVRNDGAFAAAATFFFTGKLQLLGTTGAPMGAGVPFPISDAVNGFYLALQPTPTGYRLTTVRNTMPREVQRVELDATGAAIGAPTPLGTFMANQFGIPSALAASDRSLFALPYSPSASAHQLRLIQTCD